MYIFGISIFEILGIIIFIIGLLLVIFAFLTYTRRGEAEMSQDVLITPKFIVGILMIIGAVVAKFIFK